MDKNYIIGEIEIQEKDINKNIRIINTFEQTKRENKWKDGKDDYKYENEKEIKDNCEIKINNKVIPFNYYHKFNEKGKCVIKYIFKKNITNMSFMFFRCESLSSINLSNFNAQNVTNMNEMFSGCESLSSINLSNFNTQNVNYMSGMFGGCKSLSSINLSIFNTQNVTDMNLMFDGCGSLSKNIVKQMMRKY